MPIHCYIIVLVRVCVREIFSSPGTLDLYWPHFRIGVCVMSAGWKFLLPTYCLWHISLASFIMLNIFIFLPEDAKDGKLFHHSTSCCFMVWILVKTFDTYMTTFPSFIGLALRNLIASSHCDTVRCNSSIRKRCCIAGAPLKHWIVALVSFFPQYFWEKIQDFFMFKAEVKK